MNISGMFWFPLRNNNNSQEASLCKKSGGISFGGWSLTFATRVRVCDYREEEAQLLFAKTFLHKLYNRNL
jgi:hypothetical protein